ncbi:MAG: MFS transporter [Dehalococcoidia bacterium]|nr:MAG: MFS transporter [Dehalococcoidia bacterium]
MFIASRKKRPHYGWIILAASFLIALLTYGVQYSFGVFLTELEEEFQWTRAMISWVPGLHVSFMCVFGLFAGWFTDRYGPRVIVGIGGFFTGLGLVLTSQVSAPWQLYVYYSFMVGLGIGFCAGPPIFTTVSKWFVERRGLALGIVASGIGLGTIVMAPVARYLISAYSWQTSYLVIGFATWVIIVAALLLKKQPEDIGVLPNGGGSQTRHNPPPELKGLTLSQALRTRALWLLIILFIFAFAGLLMVMYHLVAHAEDIGIPEMTAATFLSVIGATSIPGRILVGSASDKIGRKPVLIFCLLLQAVMMLWLIKSTSVWMFYLFAVIWGFGYGGWAPLMPAITAELFGLRHMGSILGLVAFSFGIGGAAGPALAGHIYTATDSYSTAWLIGAVGMFLAAMIIPLLKVPRTG